MGIQGLAEKLGLEAVVYTSQYDDITRWYVFRGSDRLFRGNLREVTIFLSGFRAARDKPQLSLPFAGRPGFTREFASCGG